MTSHAPAPIKYNGGCDSNISHSRLLPNLNTSPQHKQAINMKTFVCIALLVAAALAAPAPENSKRDKRGFLSGLSYGGYSSGLYDGYGYGASIVSAPIIEHTPTIISEPIVVKKIVSVPRVVAVKKIVSVPHVSYAPAISHGWW